MGEFLVIFAVTCLILGLLIAAMYFGRPPIYQVTREEALKLLNQLLLGTLKEVKWLIFIGHPILADPQLNDLRLQCAAIEQAAENGDMISFTVGAKRYDKVGLKQIESVLDELEMLMLKTPVFKEF